MKMKGKSLYLVMAICLASAVAAFAQDNQIYTWTDENGVVHFSDTQPEGQEAETRDLAPEPASSAPNPYQQAPTGPSIAEQRRQEIAQNKQEARANQAVNDAQCAAWQAEVDRLEPHRRVFYTNEQGETERMDDVERTNRVAELKRQIAQNCR